MTITLWRHYAKSTQSICTIYVRIKFGGERADLGSTGIRIPTKDWDTVEKRVLPTHPQHQSINSDIQAMLSRIDLAYQALRKSSRPFKAKDILHTYRTLFEPETYEPKASKVLSVAEVFQQWVNHREEIYSEGMITYSTFKKNREAKTKLFEYLQEKDKMNLPIHEFNLRAAQRYRAWLEKQKFGYPHVNKLLKTIRQAVRWSFENELSETNPLEGLRLKREKLNTPVYLLPYQVDNLRDVPFRSETLQKVADLFVIYCRTGFHYMDLKLVIDNPGAKIGSGLAGINWIKHPRLKTGVIAKVPIFDEILPIVEKYGGWDKLPLMTNQKMNEYLKVIAADRNLPAALSVKVGRNTLADWLLNEKGWSKEAVKVVMGIRTDAILARYVRPDERRVILELNLTTK